MIRVDATDIRRFEDDLKKLAGGKLAAAQRMARTNAAWKAREIWQGEIRDEMTLRNKYTERSVKVVPARGDGPAVVGSEAEYMIDQEFGGTKRKRGKHGVAIPTPYASNEARGSERKKLPTRAKAIKGITLGGRRVRAKNPRQKLVLQVRAAVESKQRFIFWKRTGSFGPRTGIYKVERGSMKRKRGWPRGAKMEMVHSLENRSVDIPPTPTLKPTVRKIEPLMQAMYAEAMLRTIHRELAGGRRVSHTSLQSRNGGRFGSR